MKSFDLAAIFLVLVAAAGWVNGRTLRLPAAVAMLLAGVIGSALVLLAKSWSVTAPMARSAITLLGRVDFPETVVGYMLAFLLFAGAMQVDLAELRRRRAAVWSLATLGVVASTLVTGGGLWAVARALGLPLSLPWALAFGALISPTDPVAIISTLRPGDLSPRLLSILQGEALFNDGAAIVVFLAAIALAHGHAPAPGSAVLEALAQGVGGLALGLGAGALVVRAMRAIDDYAVEVALSLALAAGVYAGGQAMHVSGAIAAVAAGLMVGDSGVKTAMSAVTRRYLLAFWELVDELLNALLFLLIGLQTAVVPFHPDDLQLSLLAIPLVLVARLAVVLPWGAVQRLRHSERGASLILAWGGLRGGLSLALALQAVDEGADGAVLSATYAVVVFSLVAQGLTFAPLARRLRRDGRQADEGTA